MSNHFTELAGIDVGEWLEKKGNLSYLSWPHAVHQMLTRDPATSWEYRWADGVPFVKIGDTAMVFCTVTFCGIARTAQLPVMDNRNKPIANPDSFAVNTAMQRCLVKAIALHGLGLYVYAGEDLPAGKEPEPAQVPVELAAAINAADSLDALRTIFRPLDKEMRAAVQPLIDKRRAELATPEKEAA